MKILGTILDSLFNTLVLVRSLRGTFLVPIFVFVSQSRYDIGNPVLLGGVKWVLAIPEYMNSSKVPISCSATNAEDS